MNKTLFITLIKKNWKLWLIFFSVLTMYMTIMISMFDPNDMEALIAMMDMFPESIIKAMGYNSMVTGLTGYLASWLYGLLMFGFPMVYSIILGNKLVAKMVDNSSFAYLLSTPNSRVKIIVTKGTFALTSLLLLFGAVFLIGLIISAIIHPDTLDTGSFFKLNFTTMLVNMVVMMISFFFSCLFNESRQSLSFGAGIPIVFLFMNMLGGAADKISFLKKFSIYGLYDPVDLVNGAKIWHINLLYIVIIATLFIAAVMVFKKKRLPL